MDLRDKDEAVTLKTLLNTREKLKEALEQIEKLEAENTKLQLELLTANKDVKALTEAVNDFAIQRRLQVSTYKTMTNVLNKK